MVTAPPVSDSKSITFSANPQGYYAREALHRFARERIAEDSLRLVGSAAILIGLLHWFLPGLVSFGEAAKGHWPMTLGFVGTGVALFIFGVRGFRRELFVDTFRRQVVLARVNNRNASIVRYSFPMQDIESIFIQRLEGATVLMIRIKRQDRAQVVLRGDGGALNVLHGRLCADIRDALQCAVRRVQTAAPIACTRKAPWRNRQIKLEQGRRQLT